MSERQTGQTTRQMQEAPTGAVFVWCNGGLSYPRALAQTLGRTDLKIVPAAWLEDDHWRGVKSAVVLDHATVLNLSQIGTFSKHRARVR